MCSLLASSITVHEDKSCNTALNSLTRRHSPRPLAIPLSLLFLLYHRLLDDPHQPERMPMRPKDWCRIESALHLHYHHAPRRFESRHYSVHSWLDRVAPSSCRTLVESGYKGVSIPSSIYPGWHCKRHCGAFSVCASPPLPTRALSDPHPAPPARSLSLRPPNFPASKKVRQRSAVTLNQFTSHT